MPDVFSQLYVQLVFAVKYRHALIAPAWEERLYQYTTVTLENRGHKMLAIGGMPDHVHLFIGYNPAEALSDCVREIKKTTNHFINDHGLCNRRFSWQRGFGAFSYSRSQIDAVCRYVLNQKEHHRAKSFREEYMALLHDFGIEIGRKEVFEFFD